MHRFFKLNLVNLTQVLLASLIFDNRRHHFLFHAGEDFELLTRLYTPSLPGTIKSCHTRTFPFVSLSSSLFLYQAPKLYQFIF